MTKKYQILLYLYVLTGILIKFSGYEIFPLLIFYTSGLSFIFVYWSKKIDQFLYQKRPTFRENLEISIKKFYLNRDYLRLKSFWHNDFRKTYKKVKIQDLIWQIPLMLGISVYTILLTRLKAVTIVFFLRCWVQILLLDNPIGYLYLVLYFVPLIILTLLAGLPPITKKLIKTYGINTMKKLGFNIFTNPMFNNAKIVVKAGAIVAVSDAAAGIVNTESSWAYNDFRYNREVRSVDIATRKYEEVFALDPHTTIKKPVYPDREEFTKDKIFSTRPKIIKAIKDALNFPFKKK